MPRKKKPFIQKKHANTYSISLGHDDFSDKMCSNQTHLQGSEDRDREKTVAESSGTVSVQQNRKEMLDLCLVDDGYDYTQHLRSIKLDSPDQVSSATKDIYLPSSNASPGISNPHKSNIFTGHHMENEILEIIDTIETIELSDGKAKETGDLEDTFFLEAMQPEKVLADVIENPFLLSEENSTSLTHAFQPGRSSLRNKVDIGDSCNLYPSGRVGSDESRKASKNVQAQVGKTIPKIITEEISSVVNLKSPEIKYDKTRLGEENLQMLQETFSNTPSVIKDENENTHSRVIIEKQFTQNVDFIVNTAIPESWRWNIRRKGEDRSEKSQRKHAVKEGRRVARLAKKNLKKSFKELNQATKS